MTTKADYMREYYTRPYAKAAQRNRDLKRKYGLTLEEYEARLAAQGGVCALCGGPCSSGQQLAVDHCHTTNRVRGLLCGSCNLGLGKFRDAPVLLRLAADYLEG